MTTRSYGRLRRNNSEPGQRQHDLRSEQFQPLCANRITEIQTKNGSGTQLSDIQYSYDGVNELTRTDTDGTVTTFGYDLRHEVAQMIVTCHMAA